MENEKSPGMLQYERETEGLLERYRAKQVDFAEFYRTILAALNRCMFTMSESELLGVQRDISETIFNVTDALAKLGHPVPGADPDHPN
jgi:hypothetical protein